MKKEDNMLKNKMLCSRKSAWVYKILEIEEIYSLEQNTVCYCLITLIKKKLHYCISINSISRWVLWWYLATYYLS